MTDSSVRWPWVRRENNPSHLKSLQLDKDKLVRAVRFDTGTSVSMPTAPKIRRCSTELGKGKEEENDEDE
jgi:hypothetical protein